MSAADTSLLWEGVCNGQVSVVDSCFLLAMVRSDVIYIVLSVKVSHPV